MTVGNWPLVSLLLKTFGVAFYRLLIGLQQITLEPSQTTRGWLASQLKAQEDTKVRAVVRPVWVVPALSIHRSHLPSRTFHGIDRAMGPNGRETLHARPGPLPCNCNHQRSLHAVCFCFCFWPAAAWLDWIMHFTICSAGSMAMVRLYMHGSL